MAVEMDMNYPSHAVDAIMEHRYQGLEHARGAPAAMGRYQGIVLPRQDATAAMLEHRYGGLVVDRTRPG